MSELKYVSKKHLKSKLKLATGKEKQQIAEILVLCSAHLATKSKLRSTFRKHSPLWLKLATNQEKQQFAKT